MKREALYAFHARLGSSHRTAWKLLRTLGLLVCALAPALALQQSHAATATDNLAVSATVSQKCIVAASAVAFGAYDPVVTNASTALNATGSLSVTCTKNSTGITVALGLGANASASVRRMISGSEYLTYELYHPSATTAAAACTFPGTTVWGTAGPNVFTPSGTTWGAGSAQAFNVCGSVAGGQNVAAGSYSDTIVATIDF